MFYIIKQYYGERINASSADVLHKRWQTAIPSMLRDQPSLQKKNRAGSQEPALFLLVWLRCEVDHFGDTGSTELILGAQRDGRAQSVPARVVSEGRRANRLVCPWIQPLPGIRLRTAIQIRKVVRDHGRDDIRVSISYGERD